MPFLKRLSETFRRDARKYKTLMLRKQRVDVEYDEAPIYEGEAYCRLWLVDMGLARDVDWFKSWYPVVHAAISFHYGKQFISLPFLARPDALRDISQEHLDRVIQRNYAMTPLFPFNEGLLELEAGLFSMESSDPIGRLITSLSTFSKVVPLPGFPSTINMADLIYGAFEDLLDIGKGRLELGYRQTFTTNTGGSNFLRPGYFAAIMAEEGKFNEDTLCIINDSLRIGVVGENKEFLQHPYRPLGGYSYMLFRWEKITNQDWESLADIQDLVYKAQDAINERKSKQAQDILNAIKVAIFRHPYVTRTDRRQMYAKIENFLREFGLQSAGQQLPKLSLYPIMQKSLPQLSPEQEAELDRLEKILNP